jgi:hypothetical protein
MGGAMAFQAKWVGVCKSLYMSPVAAADGIAGGSGFTIFLLILAFLLSAFLFITPNVYDK